jgi:hypothetical protein
MNNDAAWMRRDYAGGLEGANRMFATGSRIPCSNLGIRTPEIFCSFLITCEQPHSSVFPRRGRLAKASLNYSSFSIYLAPERLEFFIRTP